MSGPQFPLPSNEPEVSFRQGTQAAVALNEALGQRDVVEIPTVIGGKRYYSNDVVEVRAPHDTQRLLARIHRPTEAQISEAIASSKAVAKDWASLSHASRATILHRASDIIATRKRMTINAATMLGQSKTIDQAEPDSACELIDFLRFNAYNAQRVYAEQPMSVPSAVNRADWRPLEGFVYAVSPFNFTAIGGNLTTAPAIMGNTVLWKPSEKSALANYIFFEALEEAGLPPGVINFVPGDAELTTRVALSSPDLAGIHFTGSSAVFQGLWKEVASKVDTFRTIPRLVGETGGKDFVLAHPSANASEVAIALIRGAFEYQGQKCSAASRAYIPRSLWNAVRQELRDRLAQLKVGDVANPGTFMGAVISQASHQKLSRVISAAKEDAAVTVVHGGKTWSDPGYFVEPTVFEVTDPKHRLMKEEFFGPVLSVFVYEDNAWNETLELIDSTSPYALTGSIFCTDRFALHHAEKVLVNAAGNLYLNDKPTGAMIGQQPFGGGRASGTNDKAGSYLNLLRWASPRVVKETYLPPREWQFGA
ncbi:trifunctional transcriptional regulator/proline dehydrogenase/pyrroline-5-carboxylate dehydrogenase [Caballeronia hypogeia]|uniref:L-glutamate gamma-semialdehyde dehydrogenase n=1 Tax=Caballeronia hypogeia TaxID=1777140 RepID=A0A158D6G2_9BURK|nr:L-glutamate gamma-semialdehyde dehydrogenase [Caballeronia hypogeia]SAK90242.1 trifunctional transcriptional regulator/proline dehydrogenase/pyrroline-5-carboxylate dehydrogenase [Caballeronia hypogeia]